MLKYVGHYQLTLINGSMYTIVAACIALRDLNLEFYKSESFLENHIVHEAQIFLCLVMPYVALRAPLPGHPNASQNLAGRQMMWTKPSHPRVTRFLKKDLTLMLFI